MHGVYPPVAGVPQVRRLNPGLDVDVDYFPDPSEFNHNKKMSSRPERPDAFSSTSLVFTPVEGEAVGPRGGGTSLRLCLRSSRVLHTAYFRLGVLRRDKYVFPSGIPQQSPARLQT